MKGNESVSRSYGVLVDGRGRLARKGFTYALEGQMNRVTKAYDSFDAQTTVTQSYRPAAGATATADIIESFTYDASHLLLTVHRDGQTDVGYGWRDDWLLGSKTVGNTTIGYDYAADTRRLQTVTGPWGVSTVSWEPWRRAARGRSLRPGLKPGVEAHDTAGRLSDTTATAADGTTLAQVVYGYDGRGNRTSEARRRGHRRDAAVHQLDADVRVRRRRQAHQ